MGYFKKNAAAAGELADLIQVDWAVKKYEDEVRTFGCRRDSRISSSGGGSSRILGSSSVSFAHDGDSSTGSRSRSISSSSSTSCNGSTGVT